MSMGGSLLLDHGFVGLSRPLEDRRLLQGLRMNGLARKLSMHLLLSGALRALGMLLLLGSLQDLLRKLPRKVRHAWVLRLFMRHLVLVVSGHRSLVRCNVLLLLQHPRWGSLERLLTHHGLDLLQAHNLPRGSRNLLRRLLLPRGRRLFGLQTPDVGTRLQPRDVLGILVAFVASPGGLGSMGNRRLLLDGRASLVDDLLLLQGVCNLCSLAGEVEIPPDALLGRWAAVAEGVVVEGIVSLVELVAQAVVRLLEVNSSLKSVQSCGMARVDMRIIVGCPSSQASEGIVVAKAGGIRRVAVVTRQGRVEAEEGHGGRGPRADGGGGGGWVVFRARERCS